jgi:hypothetical protein
MDQETHRCPICQAEFASSDELLRHEKSSHTQQGSARPNEESPTDERERPRQGREFTRSNRE